ncbi:hypothetical protein Ae201684P_020266 [Aphanomyces euteiches]|nr:hypothetical protein Ae201684P_020266 [Aphanomyces euteiches]KAH9153728.1 hypothetical protein AeRB84_004072 [Aphanomyces euteiches]
MAKVDVVRPATTSSRPAAVCFNRLSLVYSSIFTLKLAATPFFAYMTEPWPRTVTHRVNPPWPSFDAFTNATLAKLQRIYNNQTLDPQTICKYDSATNSHVMRYTLDLPHAVPEDAWLVQLTNFPAAFLYGAGLRRFVYTFLQANQTERRTIPWHECEHVWMVGVALSEVCVWIEQPSPDHSLSSLPCV